MADKFDSPIFVLGLPRSGTSMVAGSLAACGVWTGTTIAPNDANPKGFFEHAVVREQVIKPMLSSMGCDPLGVRVLPTESMLNQKVPNLQSRIKKIVRDDGYKGPNKWLYKDAKLTLLWPIFANAFPNARWVIVRREQEQFIDSCLRTSFMKQHSMEREYWAALFEEYTKRLRALKSTERRTYVIDAMKIAQGELSTFEKLCVVLGLRFNEPAVEQFVSRDLFNRTS